MVFDETRYSVLKSQLYLCVAAVREKKKLSACKDVHVFT